MNRNDTYKTKQKDLIIDIIKTETHEFTIKDIYNKLNGKVGLTTIYRLVDKLVDDNKLNKYIDKNNITYYQYLEECNHDNHFYLRCKDCGEMIHIDCDCIKDLSNHILKKHKFYLKHEQIIMNGICDKCMRRY